MKLLAAILMLSLSVGASSFYVDNALTGSANSGLSWANAWTNFSSVNWAALSAGDTLYISGGTTSKIYRETLTVGKAGTLGNPITVKRGVDSGHTGTPIIDGSEPITNWVACSNAGEAGGNTNWSHIYKGSIAALPNSATIIDSSMYPTNYGPTAANLWHGTNAISLCQVPKADNPLYVSGSTLYNTYYATATNYVSNTNLTDARLAGLGGTNLVGSYIHIWASPNDMFFRKINSYDPVATNIVFDSVVTVGGSVYTDRDTRWAIMNNLSNTLSAAGDVYIDRTADGGGRYPIYVWPLNDEDVATTKSITIATRTPGFSFGGYDHVTVDGLTMRYFAGPAVAGGGTSPSVRSKSLTIQNSDVSGGIAGSGAGMIYLTYTDTVTISSNYIHQTRLNNRAFTDIGATNLLVISNRFDKISGSGVYFGGCTNSTVTRNVFRDSHGIHANSITLYQGCDGIMVSDNSITGSSSPLALQASGNIVYQNNVVIGDGGANFNSWGSCFGTVTFYNNTIVKNTNNVAISFPELGATLIVINNILDGGGTDTIGSVRHNNIYTGLAWWQTAGNGWYLGTGESVSTDAALFVDAANDDYRLTATSPAIGAGTNLNSYFTADIAGLTRGSVWDIGAYEFAGPSGSMGPTYLRVSGGVTFNGMMTIR